jgi:EAL domain-containing protein (putative c-di-GMP-specific phosphodiesterase class I)
MLRKAGCGEAQGYLIGVPAKAADMSRLLRSQALLRQSL